MPPFPMPATAQAVQAAAVYVQHAWITASATLLLPESQRVRYVVGLTQSDSLTYPDAGDPLQARVTNRARNAAVVEYGRGPLHLPSVIRWAQSRAAKRSKTTGHFYIHVPFRHVVAGSFRRPSVQAAVMPARVYRVARLLQPGQRLTAGPTRGRALHAPGLTPYGPRYGRNVRPGYEHAAREEGMRRVPGQGRRGTYMTFRTMTSASQGWWLPPQPATHVARQVERETAGVVTQMIEAGLRADLAATIKHRVEEGRA